MENPATYTPEPAPLVAADAAAFGPMPQEQRAIIKQLAEAATPGPWRTDGFSAVLTVAETQPVYDWSKPLGGGKYPLLRHESAAIAHLNDGEYIENPNSNEDAAYLAALSPEVTLATLGYVEQLEAKLTTLRARAEKAEARLAEEQQASAAKSVELEQRRLRYEQLVRELLAECAADPSDCLAEWAMLKSFDLTGGPFDEAVIGLLPAENMLPAGNDAAASALQGEGERGAAESAKDHKCPKCAATDWQVYDSVFGCDKCKEDRFPNNLPPYEGGPLHSPGPKEWTNPFQLSPADDE